MDRPDGIDIFENRSGKRPARPSMIPKKPAPDAIRGGYRFSEKTSSNKKRPVQTISQSGMTIRRKRNNDRKGHPAFKRPIKKAPSGSRRPRAGKCPEGSDQPHFAAGPFGRFRC
jgi:hypothetical protein